MTEASRSISKKQSQEALVAEHKKHAQHWPSGET